MEDMHLHFYINDGHVWIQCTMEGCGHVLRIPAGDANGQDLMRGALVDSGIRHYLIKHKSDSRM